MLGSMVKPGLIVVDKFWLLPSLPAPAASLPGTCSSHLSPCSS